MGGKSTVTCVDSPLETTTNKPTQPQTPQRERHGWAETVHRLASLVPRPIPSFSMLHADFVAC